MTAKGEPILRRRDPAAAYVLARPITDRRGRFEWCAVLRADLSGAPRPSKKAGKR